MRTIPTALWPHLLSQKFNPVEVYEIEPIDVYGAAERLGNPDFETWASSSDLSGWSEFPTTGTIVKDTTNMRTGTACVKMTSAGGGEAIERYDIHLAPGQWHTVECWVKSTVAKANGYALRIVNLTTVRELKTDMTWSAGNTGLRAQAGDMVGGGVWQRFAIQFQTEATAGAADNYAISLQQYAGAGWSAGNDMWFDSASIKGGYERPWLYFSDQDIAWQGNAHVGLASERTPIKEDKAAVVPETTITFSNVQNTLRPYLYPVDMLTGARLTVRLLIRDSAMAVLDDSLVRFVGIIEPPKRIDDSAFVISVVGFLDSGGVQVPARRYAISCPWQFANAGLFDGSGHCQYIRNTTANGAGAATTALVLTAASTFANGDSIQVGGNTPVTIVSGGGTVNLVISAAQTWANGADVRYSTCDLSRPACDKRLQLYSIGSFPGASMTARLKEQATQRVAVQERAEARDLSKTGANQQVLVLRRLSTVNFADPTIPLPIIYGRRRVDPRLVELKRDTLGAGLTRTGFFGVCEGPIESIVKAWADDTEIVDVIASSVKTYGIYVRLGDHGINDIETAAEYLASQVRVRSQNVDYRSYVAAAYSETAYVIFIQNVVIAADNKVPDPPRFEVDVKGVKVQLYDIAGAPAGAKVWSENNLWCSCDIMLSDKHGIGLAASDLDFSVIKPEADYADEYISGTEAQTTIAVSQASPTVVCKVRSSEGFTVGRRVDVNFVANTCAAVVSDNEITLGTAVTQTINQIVRQIPRRFEAHLLIDSVAPAIRWIERILAACRGYITYDAGRIQLRIERDTVKERLPNGDFELWSSSTNADSWTEDIAAGGLTVNRDGTIKSGGSFSLRLDRTVESTFGGVYQSVTGLEPGRWYRITFQHKQDALGIGTACRLFILNVTKGLYLDADGITWGTSRRVIDQEGATAFTQYEVTFKVREDFALTDAIRFALTPNFTAGHSVWYDDVHVRGPYAGDFREFTTGLNMGWAENTFRWSLDSKDRETNRVSVRFLNQSGRFGDDEVAANDFVHQRRHYVKTKEINGDCFSDRDQAARICQLELAKIRQLGPGCEFLGTPAALALQPGDVILVSDTVPGWSCKEQRVLQTEVDGLGKDTEHFVTVRTEDYLESVYPDTGPPQQSLPIRPSTVLTVTVVRHTGSVLELAWSIDTDVSAALYFRIHSSATPGFAPNHLNMIGQTSANGFVYTAAESEIEEVRYYRVVAVTDYGPGTMSAEFTATIFAVDYDATDGTHGENNADGNMIYDSDFQGTEFQDGTTKNGDGWLTNSNVAYTDRDATVNLTPSGGYAANGSDLAFTSPANAYDNNLTTYAVGTATWINISSNDNVASVRYGFAAGTRTGRVKLRGKLGGSGFGYVQLRYSVSGTGGPWINFAQPLSTTDTDYVGPRLVGQNMANFFIEAIVYPRASGSNNSTSFSVAEVDFQEETAGAIYAHMVDGHLELKGDGTNYAEARRRFPGKSPPANGTYLTTSSPNRWEIKAQTLSASAPSNPLEIRLEDALTGRVWAVASVAAADVAAAWWGFTNLFDPGAFPVAGSIDIVIRTKDANGIRADQVLIKRERVITSYQVGSEDQQLGRFPDLRLGEAVNWPKGKLVVGGAYRKILVA